MLICIMIHSPKKGLLILQEGRQIALSVLLQHTNSADARFLCPICPDQSSAGSHRCSAARLAACLFVYDERCFSCLPSVIRINGRTQACPPTRTLLIPFATQNVLTTTVVACFASQDRQTKLDAVFQHLE